MTRRTFTRKPSSGFLYTWSPNEFITKLENGEGTVRVPYFCNATPRSQSEDWISTYSYQEVVENGQIKRIAYVECDYVR